MPTSSTGMIKRAPGGGLLIIDWIGAAGRVARWLERLENRASRNSPSFAVALNCGMGSSSLNADVNALERLQIVRGRNWSYFGSKYRSCTVRARCLVALHVKFSKADLPIPPYVIGEKRSPAHQTGLLPKRYVIFTLAQEGILTPTTLRRILASCHELSLIHTRSLPLRA